MTSKSKPHVLVVGGGIMGTSAALELALQGARVTVLEKALPGAEASSAAAGILGAEIENADPGPMLDLCRKSQALYPAWVEFIERESGVPVGLEAGGSLELASSKAELARLEKQRAHQLSEGRAQLLGKRELSRLEPHLSSDLAGAIFFPSDRRVVPPALFRAVHLAALARGVEFRTGRHATKVVTETKRGRGARAGGVRACGIELDDESVVQADVTVVAAGSWTSLLSGLPLQRGAIVPARGQLVELDLGAPRLHRVAVGAGVYLIPRADGRLLVGSTLEFVGYQKAVTAAGLHHLLGGALRVMPELEAAEVTRSWSNFRPYTRDHLPLLGSPGIADLIVASGHYRNGILLAPITARIVSALALKRRPPIALSAFDPRRTAHG
jgi:glycine oxidase